MANKTFHKPKIVISKCINFEACRHNGSIISEPFLETLGKYVDYVTVCPEVEIGLGTPRKAIRISRDEHGNTALYQPSSGANLTQKMNNFSKKYVEKLQKTHIDGFILKNRSPSCGTTNVKIYKSFDSNMSEGKSAGFFAQKIIDSFSNTPIEDEGRLKNFKIRGEFLMKIFCLTEFRNLKKDIGVLTHFHQNNKFMFMVFKPSHNLGKIIAGYNKHNIEKVFEDYREELEILFQKYTSKGRMINAFEHIFGGFKNSVSENEKKHYLEQLALYKNNQIPTSSIIGLFQVFSLHYKNEYVENQTLLNPYPSELLYLHDSGKDLVL